MKVFKLAATFFLLIILFGKISWVYAQDAQSLINDVNKFQNQASKAAAAKERRLADVIKKADTLVTTRINNLNNLITRIKNDPKLTADQKTNLTSQVQTAISGLTSLKAKIDADTDVTTALADGKQIFTNYRVYEEFEPKIRFLILLNNLSSTATKIQSLMPQLQNIVNNLKSQGKDVSGLTPLLADINAQLQTINSSITSDIATVSALTPSSTNSQTTFQQVKNDIQNIRGDFTKIKDDMTKMRVVFRQIILPSATSGGSVSASLTPSSSPLASPAASQ